MMKVSTGLKSSRRAEFKSASSVPEVVLSMVNGEMSVDLEPKTQGNWTRGPLLGINLNKSKLELTFPQSTAR